MESYFSVQKKDRSAQFQLYLYSFQVPKKIGFMARVARTLLLGPCPGRTLCSAMRTWMRLQVGTQHIDALVPGGSRGLQLVQSARGMEEEAAIHPEPIDDPGSGDSALHYQWHVNARDSDVYQLIRP